MFNCSRLLPVEVPEPPLQPEDRVLVRHVQHRRRRNILAETTIFKGYLSCVPESMAFLAGYSLFYGMFLLGR